MVSSRSPSTFALTDEPEGISDLGTETLTAPSDPISFAEKLTTNFPPVDSRTDEVATVAFPLKPIKMDEVGDKSTFAVDVDQGVLKRIFWLAPGPLTVILPEEGDVLKPETPLIPKEYVPFGSENVMTGIGELRVVPFNV